MNKKQPSIRAQWNHRDMHEPYVSRRRRAGTAAVIAGAALVGAVGGLLPGSSVAEGSEQTGTACDVQIGQGNTKGLITENAIAEALGADSAMTQKDRYGQQVQGLDRAYDDSGSRLVFKGDHFVARDVDAQACRVLGGKVINAGLGSGPQG